MSRARVSTRFNKSTTAHALLGCTLGFFVAVGCTPSGSSTPATGSSSAKTEATSAAKPSASTAASPANVPSTATPKTTASAPSSPANTPDNEPAKEDETYLKSDVDKLEPDAKSNEHIARNKEFVAAHLKRFQESKICAKDSLDEYKPLCGVVTPDALANAPLTPLFDEPPVRVGVTLWIPTEGDVAEDLPKYSKFSAFSIARRKGGTQAFLSPLTPPDVKRKIQIRQAWREVGGQLAKPQEKIFLEGELLDFVKDLPRLARHPIVAHDHGWQLRGGAYADIRKVGSFWVATEVPLYEPKGMYMTVLLDAIPHEVVPESEDDFVTDPNTPPPTEEELGTKILNKDQMDKIKP